MAYTIIYSHFIMDHCTSENRLTSRTETDSLESLEHCGQNAEASNHTLHFVASYVKVTHVRLGVSVTTWDFINPHPRLSIQRRQH